MAEENSSSVANRGKQNYVHQQTHKQKTKHNKPISKLTLIVISYSHNLIDY